MPEPRPVVAALLFLLFAQAAAGDCLTPVWELGAPPFPPAGSFRLTTVFDDFDGDGIADAVFVRTVGVTDTATFQRGRGNGFFATPADIYTATPSGIHLGRTIQHVIARDLDRDGRLDLLLLENHEHVIFLQGNGDGSFANPVASSTFVGDEFAIADLTGDDVDDVVAFYYNAGFGVVLFAGTTAGTFAETTRIPLPAPPRTIAAGDLDGDGANDIVAGYDDPSNLALLFGNDDGTFDPAITRTNDDTWATKIQLADLENDGDLDIIVVNNLFHLSVHRNRGGRTFDPVAIYPVSQPFTSVHHSNRVAVADVNGDGVRDLLVTTSNNSLATLRGLGDGTFGTPHYELFPWPNDTTAPVDTTDFDGDGRVDVIIGPNSFGGLRALRNRCGDVNVLITATPPADPAAYNATVHVSARGYDEGSEEPPPVDATGTVSILEGATVLATGTLSNGEVTLNVRGLRPGAYTLVARYGGDDQYEPAESAGVLVRVTQTPASPLPPRRRSAGH
jgi:hypothetical protein